MADQKKEEVPESVPELLTPESSDPGSKSRKSPA